MGREDHVTTSYARPGQRVVQRALVDPSMEGGQAKRTGAFAQVVEGRAIIFFNGWALQNLLQPIGSSTGFEQIEDWRSTLL